MSSASDLEMGGQRHAPATLTQGNRPGTHCIRGRGGPQGGSGRVRKISHPRGFDPRTVQPIAIRYTDNVVPAHMKLLIRKFIN
jgi:hypothetical protein